MGRRGVNAREVIPAGVKLFSVPEGDLARHPCFRYLLGLEGFARSLRKHRNITLLGSTGSIGTSTLEVLTHLRDYFSVSSLSANGNIDLLEEQVGQFRPRSVAVLDEEKADLLRKRLGRTTEVLGGEKGLLEIAGRDDSDMVLNALVGFSGLRPTLRAIEAGKDIALANKETLVVAGEIVMEAARRHHVRLLPVDSEHSAILQCLQGEDLSAVAKLIITASGGPFLGYSTSRLAAVTVEEALNHPTWKMGAKITVDSATLMNKGLEVIEACRLFGFPPEQIDVLIHPQSIIHSFVEFTDGSVKAQLAMPDMRLPIQYALTYPDRPSAPYRKMNFTELSELTFRQPDHRNFPCLGLASRALQMGGTAPAVLNAANEEAVHMFLEGTIPFTSIPEIVSAALEHCTRQDRVDLEEIFRADTETRQAVRNLVESSSVPLHTTSVRQQASI